MAEIWGNRGKAQREKVKVTLIIPLLRDDHSWWLFACTHCQSFLRHIAPYLSPQIGIMHIQSPILPPFYLKISPKCVS